MLNKAQRIVKIVKRFEEIHQGGHGIISIHFPKLWEKVEDVDINFLLGKINDYEFEKRLEHIFEESGGKDENKR